MKGWVDLAQQSGQSQIWLLAIAGGLIGLQLHWTWMTYNSFDQLTISLLFWGAALYLLWQKRAYLTWNSSPGASLSGGLLIGWMLLRRWLHPSADDVLGAIAICISCLGLSLLASGWQGPRQFAQELGVVLVLSIPHINVGRFVEETVNLSLLTAQLATFLLWYLGFPVSRQGISILLPTGAVDVLPGCSGLDAVLLMARLALLFVVVFALKGYQRWLVPAIAMLIAFGLNAARVMLMVLLLAFKQDAFDYWHGSAGAQIFSTAMIVIFGIFCQWLLHSNSQAPVAESES